MDLVIIAKNAKLRGNASRGRQTLRKMLKVFASGGRQTLIKLLRFNAKIGKRKSKNKPPTYFSRWHTSHLK